MEKAKSLNIELSSLPAYSPNLNLIERVWRFVKEKSLYSQYYEKFAEFTSQKEMYELRLNARGKKAN